jgi:hypothetical protein
MQAFKNLWKEMLLIGGYLQKEIESKPNCLSTYFKTSFFEAIDKLYNILGQYRVEVVSLAFS